MIFDQRYSTRSGPPERSKLGEKIKAATLAIHRGDVMLVQSDDPTRWWLVLIWWVRFDGWFWGSVAIYSGKMAREMEMSDYRGMPPALSRHLFRYHINNVLCLPFLDDDDDGQWHARSRLLTHSSRFCRGTSNGPLSLSLSL